MGKCKFNPYSLSHGRIFKLSISNGQRFDKFNEIVILQFFHCKARWHVETASMTRVVIHMVRIALVLRPLWLLGCQRDSSPSCASSTHTRKYVESPNEATESTQDGCRDVNENLHGTEPAHRRSQPRKRERQWEARSHP